MDLNSLIYLTGASGFFSSRAFIPAFFTATFLRYGQHFPFIGELEFVQTTGSEPTWFTSNLTILALGVLAIIEVGATKIPEAQEALDAFYKYAKSGVAALSAVGVLTSRDISFIEQTISQAGMLDMILGGAVAAVVYFFSTLRAGFMEVLAMADPDDDLGVRGLISWFEDLWSSFGVFLLILYPLVIITILAVIIGFMVAARKRAEYKEEQSKVPCGSCGQKMYACAVECPHCHAPNPEIKDIGFLGQTVDRPAGPPADHSLRLVSKRRCSRCATRLKEKCLPQTCPECGHRILGEAARQEAYVSKVRERLPKVLGISFVLSLIPVLGVIPGIIYYRVQLIAPFRSYIPASRGFLIRWLLRLLFLFLISLQLVPGVGGLMVPIMALISYAVYSGYFRKTLSDNAT
jgi:Zn finger protein HypA/HybF involved in hydrogenase expression